MIAKLIVMVIALPSRETVAVFSRWTGAELRGVSFLVFMVENPPILSVPLYYLFSAESRVLF
jgi:hypothetical protein